MAIIPQKQFFGWQEVDELGDLERLVLVITALPDEELMKTLERERANGRNEYPIRAVWNSILAGIVYQHPSIESLRRELRRNAQLREICGFDPWRGERAVPPACVYTRFCRKLMVHLDELESIFARLVEDASSLLPDLGRVLAIDSKAIHSLSKRPNDERQDGRRDTDADFGRKEYRGRREDGTLWQKTVIWFGYKLHLLVDATYELPVGFSVTKAAVADINEGHKVIDRLANQQPEIIRRCEVLTADKGYDDTDLLTKLWDEHRVKPVIDIRNMWRDGEDTRLLGDKGNVVYDYKGTVYCYCPATGRRLEMAFGGFEKDRETLKYRCPAMHYGISCKGEGQCSKRGGVRIPLAENRRIFTPLARSSYKWETYYKKRTAVERVNSRLDEGYGFEKHFIRGLRKMTMRCTLALAVMLAMAVGRIRANQHDKMRSLVKAA
ncbi:MAG: transposase [Firmicutes bacterium]|nr:transposase [Dethiobacter sp.]MBS3889419.1 transposase [Bacillota bacterium]